MRRIDLPYLDFKALIESRGLLPRCIELSDRYYVAAQDGVFEIHSDLMKDDPFVSDFIENVLPKCNQSNAIDVTTRMELDFLTLKLACASGQADENGDLSINIDVPGSPEAISRYIAGGYAVTNNYLFGDKIRKVNVLDRDGFFSGVPGYVLRTYHDEEVDEQNSGWFFWKTHGTEGEVEVEPIGWYGQLRGTMRIQCVFKVQPLATVNVMLWWGKKE